MSSVIPVFIPHVGCPHDCVFCNQRKIAGTLAAPSAEEVKKIIAEGIARANSPSPEVAFYGGSFTAIDKNFMTAYLDAAEGFAKRGEISSIRFSTRPDCIDEDVLSLISEYSVKTIELGAQSMDDAVLSRSGRGHTADDTCRAARLIKSRGYTLILQMMTHLPGSDDEKDMASAQKIASLLPDGVRIYPTVVIRETALYELMKRGEYSPQSPEEAARLGGVLLGIFKEKNIPVIRFGLNPTDDLSAGEAVAGAYHPALGEMAQSEYLLNMVKEKLRGKKTQGFELQVFVNPKTVSAMSGQKRRNKELLLSDYGFLKVLVTGDDALNKDEVRINIKK